jgi:hypothetical protein
LTAFRGAIADPASIHFRQGKDENKGLSNLRQSTRILIILVEMSPGLLAGLFVCAF